MEELREIAYIAWHVGQCSQLAHSQIVSKSFVGVAAKHSVKEGCEGG